LLKYSQAPVIVDSQNSQGSVDLKDEDQIIAGILEVVEDFSKLVNSEDKDSKSNIPKFGNSESKHPDDSEVKVPEIEDTESGPSQNKIPDNIPGSISE
jgi:hypothetical protein